ncbi:hypothetical protein CVT24_001548 [Panaeolus cyanescens]|uniref:Uncharacterized protein n=1 Tax=Panaeolus cyanescens TaxID=181874 RepID=A0A409W2X3_9AGAR|nr:hypothetical protein CVT24_001548 [Panaeolus cyanescens]
MVSLTDNLSLYSIIGMWVISYYPTFAKSAMLTKARAFNNVVPRSNISRLADKKHVPQDVAARAARAEGAHLLGLALTLSIIPPDQNGVEAMPFFGLAVLAGNYAGIDNYTMNVTCGFYLLSRMLFNYIYLNQTTRTMGNIRSLVWLLSLGAPFYLLGKSASLLASK